MWVKLIVQICVLPECNVLMWFWVLYSWLYLSFKFLLRIQVSFFNRASLPTFIAWIKSSDFISADFIENFTTMDCSCNEPCHFISFKADVSYSTFPSISVAEAFANKRYVNESTVGNFTMSFGITRIFKQLSGLTIRALSIPVLITL